MVEELNSIMSINSNIVLFAAIAPALVLAWYIYRRDKYQHEPVGQLLKAFSLGIVAVLMAAPLEALLEAVGLTSSHSTTVLGNLWEAFFGVALVEEGCKLFVLWLMLRRNKYYDEMIDGVVYATMVGLGFAAAENIGYLFGNIDSWQSVAIGRALFAVPGHFMFAVAMGYYYSLNHFVSPSAGNRAKILLFPVLLHGIYDGILMVMNASAGGSAVLLLLFVVFCILMYRGAKRRIKRLLDDDKILYHLEL